ncbi:MAG: DNA polymerase V, partial [Candidatus Omnitrophota bacterium]
GKIWGVGRKREEWLNSLGITNAYQFTKLEDDLVKKKMTVVGLRTKMELCGIDCIEIEEVQDKRMIGSSRMFGNNITIFNEVNEALSAYVATTAVKLRKQNSQASHMSVHVATSRFKSGYYANSSSTYLHQPLSNTQDLTKVATGLLRNIFKSGYAYKRVGVLLSELTQRNVQPLLFQDPECEKKQKLMDILDKFNKTTNYGKIKFASEGVSKRLWEMKQTHKSKRYTTNWNELLMV